MLLQRFRLLIVLLSLPSASSLDAQELSIDLSAQSAQTRVAAVHPVPDVNPQRRPSLHSDRTLPIVVKWTVRNIGKAAMKDILIHYYIVKVEKPEQDLVLQPNKQVVVEGALTMDFQPQEKTEAEISYKLPSAGCYQLRLEFKSSDKKSPSGSATLDLVAR